MSLLKRVISHVRDRFSRKAETPTLEGLLERAGIPRSASPELLRVAQLAGLRLDGEGSGEGGEGSGSGAGEGAGNEGNEGGEGTGSGSGDGGQSTEPEIPDGKVLADESELNRLRRIASERDKEEKDRKRKEAEESGRHEEVAKELEAEREAEKTKRENLERSITVRDVAGRLKFIDPADALLHLPDDVPNNEAAIERALKKVAEEKKYLIGGQGSRTGAHVDGSTPTTPPDIDAQIRKAEEAGDVAKSTRLKRQKAFGEKK